MEQETDIYTLDGVDVTLPVHSPRTGESVMDCAARLGLRCLMRRDPLRRVVAVIRSEGLSTFCQEKDAHLGAILEIASSASVQLELADVRAGKVRDTLRAHKDAGRLTKALELQVVRADALAEAKRLRSVRPRRAPSAWEAFEKRAEEARVAILAL